MRLSDPNFVVKICQTIGAFSLPPGKGYSLVRIIPPYQQASDAESFGVADSLSLETGWLLIDPDLSPSHLNSCLILSDDLSI